MGWPGRAGSLEDPGVVICGRDPEAAVEGGWESKTERPGLGGTALSDRARPSWIASTKGMLTTSRVRESIGCTAAAPAFFFFFFLPLPLSFSVAN